MNAKAKATATATATDYSDIEIILENLKLGKTSFVKARTAIEVILGVKAEVAESILDELGFAKTRKASKNFDDEAIGWLAESPRTSKELYTWFLANATPNKIRWIGFFEKIRKGINEVHSEKIEEEAPSKETLEEAKNKASEKPGR